ncbi:tetratricopeptide repeat protein [Trichocoleus sp. FACHB-262]|nr:tetratricopeptide repeat protein [Trichocoleus sp. FACHB-262]
MGDYTQAIEKYERNLVLARTIQNRRSEGKSLGSLVVVYEALWDYSKAIDYCQQQLAITQKNKHGDT